MQEASSQNQVAKHKLKYISLGTVIQMILKHIEWKKTNGTEGLQWHAVKKIDLGIETSLLLYAQLVKARSKTKQFFTSRDEKPPIYAGHLNTNLFNNLYKTMSTQMRQWEGANCNLVEN